MPTFVALAIGLRRGELPALRWQDPDFGRNAGGTLSVVQSLERATLRRTHITELLKAGAHPRIASERAGHSSVAVTLNIYSHAVPGLQEDAAARIDDALRKVLEG